MQGKHGHLSREQKQLALRLHAKGWRLVDIAKCRQRSNMRPIRRSKTRPPVCRVLVCRVLGSDAGQGVDPAVA